VLSVLHIVQLKAVNSAIRLAASFLATTSESVDGDVSYLECHLYLLYLVGGSADVVVLVQRVNDHQLWCKILKL
jgi:hypothetical protein